MPDQTSPIVVRQATRELPHQHMGSLHGAPPVCTIGAAFVDELYRERRISSVEWRVLRDAIWPMDPVSGQPAFQLHPAPTPSSSRPER